MPGSTISRTPSRSTSSVVVCHRVLGHQRNLAESSIGRSTAASYDAAVRVGVDLIEIERVRRALERRPRFAERVFTEAERAYCFSRANPAQHFAARFAGKEAVGKALGCGVEFMWRDIEIAGRPKPGVTLSGKVARFAQHVGAGPIDLSMTHSKELAGPSRCHGTGAVIGTVALPDAAEMRSLDAAAIDGLGIPGTVLMERAGLAAAHEVLQRHPEARRATIVCGAGNNGGDGFVVARHLRSAGLEVRTVLVGPLSRLSPDARTNHGVCKRMGIPMIRTSDRAAVRRLLRTADVAVDALLGTGATGAPRGAIGAAVAALNAASCPVVALDVPSGVDASDGTVAGDAVRAGVHRGVPRSEDRPGGRARPRPRRRRRRRRHRHPLQPGGADAGVAGHPRAARAGASQGGDLDQVRGRRRAGDRRGTGHDRRPAARRPCARCVPAQGCLAGGAGAVRRDAGADGARAAARAGAGGARRCRGVGTRAGPGRRGGRAGAQAGATAPRPDGDRCGCAVRPVRPARADRPPAGASGADAARGRAGPAARARLRLGAGQPDGGRAHRGVAEQGGRAAQRPRYAGRGTRRRPRDRLDLGGAMDSRPRAQATCSRA